MFTQSWIPSPSLSILALFLSLLCWYHTQYQSHYGAQETQTFESYCSPKNANGVLYSADSWSWFQLENLFLFFTSFEDLKIYQGKLSIEHLFVDLYLFLCRPQTHTSVNVPCFPRKIQSQGIVTVSCNHHDCCQLLIETELWQLVQMKMHWSFLGHCFSCSVYPWSFWISLVLIVCDTSNVNVYCVCNFSLPAHKFELCLLFYKVVTHHPTCPPNQDRISPLNIACFSSRCLWIKVLVKHWQWKHGCQQGNGGVIFCYAVLACLEICSFILCQCASQIAVQQSPACPLRIFQARKYFITSPVIDCRFITLRQLNFFLDNVLLVVWQKIVWSNTASSCISTNKTCLSRAFHVILTLKCTCSLWCFPQQNNSRCGVPDTRQTCGMHGDSLQCQNLAPSWCRAWQQMVLVLEPVLCTSTDCRARSCRSCSRWTGSVHMHL